MSIEKVREYFKKYDMEDRIIEFEQSTATSQMACEAIGVGIDRICKTISFEKGDGCILIQISGDCKVKNSLFKSEFGIKPKMLKADKLKELTGYEPGGVCAFAIDDERVEVYLDESLKRFDEVYPACGSHNSIAKVTLEELEKLSNGTRWVKVSENK